MTTIIPTGNNANVATNPYTGRCRLITDKAAGLIEAIEMRVEAGIDSLNETEELLKHDKDSYFAFID